MLFLANMFNYADRALLGIVVEPIRKELHLSDTQIGVLQGFAFSLFFLVAGIAIARWVDRGNRRLILVLGVGLWSAATAATGLTHDFYSLALTRMLIGVGEATVFPAAMSLLADLYPGPKLSRAASIFQASSGVGIMTGSILAGVLGAWLGWRAMFELFGAAGVALVLLIALTMRATPRTVTTGPNVDAAPGAGALLATMRSIIAMPGFAWLAVGFGMSNMVLACLPVWGPAFLQRSHQVALENVGALIGPPAVIGAVLGNVVSGIIAARVIQRGGNRRAGLIVPIIALPIAAPAYAIFLFAPTLPVALAGVAVMNFMLASSLGPCVALAVSLVEPSRRAITSTVMLIAQTLLAFALGPLLIGQVSDALVPTYGEEALRYALATMLIAPLMASLLLWVARRRITTG
nr:MFS transporter [Sphingomonas vulcanisoli]